jgi:16S rRNA (guanine966-N2)-methyltransferase
MRIVAGTHRGRFLVAPKGHSTRPTADRPRQALFNVLEHAPWSPGLAGLWALDLFAGSGALGLEALSRGADFCLFADTDPAAADAIASNLDALGLGDRAAVRRWDAGRLPQRLPSPASQVLPPMGGETQRFDLAFLDPPYGTGLVEPALAALVAGDWLERGAIVVVERGVGEPALSATDFEVLDNRAWGAARIWFLQLDRR